MFDFLRDIVSKVPDYGHADTAGDDRNMLKRRLAVLFSFLPFFIVSAD